jgi:hypothetical protein
LGFGIAKAPIANKYREKVLEIAKKEALETSHVYVQKLSFLECRWSESFKPPADCTKARL